MGARFALSFREDTIQKMAADLIAQSCLGTERDAIRALVGRYPLVDVMMLADQARMVAFQEIVAKEMSKP